MTINSLCVPLLDHSEPLDFVVVTFALELRLLQLQAKSFDKFVPREIVNQIIVIINEEHPEEARSAIEAHILPLYGKHRNKVKVLDRQKFTGTYKFIHSGWYSQQILKLLVASEIKEEAYVVFDSKSHIVRQVEIGDFIGQSGLLRHCPVNFSKDENLISRAATMVGLRKKKALPKKMVRSFAYFGLKAEDYARAVVSVSPFPMYKEATEALVEMVEKREGVNFPYWFEHYKDATEFYLSQAFLSAQGFSFDDIYSRTGSISKFIFEATASNPDEVRRRIEKMDGENLYSFGVHRSALKVANSDVQKMIANFWQKIGLICEPSEAAYFFSMELPQTRIK